MQRTELASLYKATPADGTKVTVCGGQDCARFQKYRLHLAVGRQLL